MRRMSSFVVRLPANMSAPPMSSPDTFCRVDQIVGKRTLPSHALRDAKSVEQLHTPTVGDVHLGAAGRIQIALRKHAFDRISNRKALR